MLAVHLADALLPIVLECSILTLESVAGLRRRGVLNGDLIDLMVTSSSLSPIAIDSPAIARLICLDLDA